MRAYLYLVAVVVIWGFWYLTTEKLLQSGWDPEWMNAIRFVIGGAALLGIALAVRGRSKIVQVQRSYFWQILLVAWVGVALGMWLLTWAQTMVPSSTAGALSVGLPLWVVLLSTMRFFGSLRIRFMGWLGVGLGTAGVVLIYGPGGSASFLGSCLVIASMFFLALESIFFQRWFSGADTLVATGLVSLWTGAAFLFIAIPGDFAAGNWWLLVAMGLLSNALAYLIFFSLITLRSAAFANLYNYLVPPVAVVAGVILGGDSLSALMVAGSIVAALGALLAARGLGRPEELEM